MLAGQFYNKLLRKYVVIFGTLFNNIVITRHDSAGVEVQRFKVPMSYGPAQKFLQRLASNPDLNDPSAITLPRISFEVVNINYDGQRKVVKNRKSYPTANNDIASVPMAPAPYNIDFIMYIMVKYEEDGNKIIEQILPFFRPDWTSSVRLLDNIEEYWDVPLILNSSIREDTYEGDFTERRAVIWTLNFTMKGLFFGPIQDKKLIKFVDANIYDSMNATLVAEGVTVQPGLTANGEPTTDITQTVPYSEINKDDDWDYIVQITED